MYITDSQNSPLKNISDINGQLAYRGQLISGSAGTGSSNLPANATGYLYNDGNGNLSWYDTQSIENLIKFYNPLAFYRADQSYNFSNILASNNDKIWKLKDLGPNNLDLFAISGSNYAPTYYQTGFNNRPTLRFGEISGSYLECISGNINLRNHTVILVYESKEVVDNKFGRILILGTPSGATDIGQPTAECIIEDNYPAGLLRTRILSKNTAIGTISTSSIPIYITGVISYQANNFGNLTYGKYSINRVVNSSSTITDLSSTTSGIRVGTAVPQNTPIFIGSGPINGNISLMAIFPKYLTDSTVDLITEALKKEYKLN